MKNVRFLTVLNLAFLVIFGTIGSVNAGPDVLSDEPPSDQPAPLYFERDHISVPPGCALPDRAKGDNTEVLTQKRVDMMRHQGDRNIGQHALDYGLVASQEDVIDWIQEGCLRNIVPQTGPLTQERLDFLAWQEAEREAEKD